MLRIMTMKNIRFCITLLIGIISTVFLAGKAECAAYDRRTPVVEAVEKILPNVVNISTTKEVLINRNPFPGRFQSPFDDFFNEVFQQRYQLEGLGSGVLVEGGYVVTNYHVVSYEEYHVGPADEILLTLYKEKEPREAILYGADPTVDIAILKIKGETPRHYVAWGHSDDLMIGETVIAAGSALGQPFTITTGIISALNRTIQTEDERRYSNLIQTNADINRGNSGGPLVNINGEFIGLNTMILSPSGGSVGLGFAIPVSRIQKVFDYWVNQTVSVEDQMGLEIQDIDPRIVRYLRDTYTSLRGQSLDGVLISKVSLSGLSAQYLKPLDLITAVDGKSLEDSNDFLNHLEEHNGDTLRLKIIREGKLMPVEIPTPNRKVKTMDWLGMQLQVLDHSWRKWYGLDPQHNGLVVLSVQKNSAAEQAGIKRGDVLVNINNQYDLFQLEDLRSIQKALKQKTDLVLYMYRLVDQRWNPRRIPIRTNGML